MAEIKTYPLFRHLRAEPTSHVLGYRRGELRRDGPGQAFWFRAINTAIAEVPIDDRELPFLFHVRSADFQALTVQGVITYRVVDPQRVARRIDFAIDLNTGRWTQTPLEQLAGLVMQLAQQFVIDELVKRDVRQILADGVAPIRAHIAAGLAAEPALERPRDRGRRGARGRGRADLRAGEGAAAADARGDPAARRRGDVPAPRAGGREGARDRRERAAEPDRAGAPRGGAGRARERERRMAEAQAARGRGRAPRALALPSAQASTIDEVQGAQLRIDAERAKIDAAMPSRGAARAGAARAGRQPRADRAPDDHAGHAHARC